VETNAEEYEAVKVAMRAFRESRFGDVRNLLSPFASAPSLPPTLVTLARTCIAEGDFPAAERHLKDAEARFPQEPQIWRALAILHRLQRKHVEELTYRRNLLFLVPRPASGAYLAFLKAFAKVPHNDPSIAT
jgi:predicted Zn-dependent protease